jgi:hypothetical protein
MSSETVAPPESDPLARLDAPPVFVVGVARSGTTWVQAILRSHPEVIGAYETSLFAAGGPIATLLDSERWKPGAKDLARFMNREDMIAEIRRFAGRVLMRRLGPTHRYLVEKTPAHLFAMPLIAEIFPEARFIHVLRDGRDVYVSVRQGRRSWARWSNRRLQLSAPGQARLWKRALGEVERVRPVLDGRLMEIRYEELKADPFGSYRRLLDFAGIPYDDPFLHEVHRRTDFDLNHPPDESAFYRGGRVRDWQTHMNIGEGLMYNIVAGDALVRWGYEASRRWFAPLRRKVRPPRRPLVRKSRTGTGEEAAS